MFGPKSYALTSPKTDLSATPFQKAACAASGLSAAAPDCARSSDYDREKLQERLAKLAGGVGVIRVGVSTEVEVKEKKDRVDDAMHATKAAVEEGIVPGGGVALLPAKAAIGKLSDENADIQAGINIVLRALEAPIRQIAENAGVEARGGSASGCGLPLFARRVGVALVAAISMIVYLQIHNNDGSLNGATTATARPDR